MRRGEERGAVAALVAMALFLLIGAAAFAVDLGLWMWTSNRLQAASDLAVLAGAQVRGEGGNQASVEAAVREVLVANGIDPAQASRTVTVGLISRSDVRVDLVQRQNPMFFSRLLVDNVTLNRTAQASTGICLSRCSREIRFDPPPNLVLRSNGDGLTPVIMGDRIFTVNHHAWNAYGNGAAFSDPIVCYELATGTACPGYHTGGTISTSMVQRVRAYAPRNELWFTYSDYDAGSGLMDWFMGCWDTQNRVWCGQWRLLDDYAGNVEQDGMSQPAQVGNRLYTFGLDDRVWCFDMAASGPCATYPRTDPNITALGNSSEWYGPDTHVVGTRIYRTHLTSQTYLACWDTTMNGPCAGFTPVDIGPATGGWWGGATLMPSLDANALVNGVCFLGMGPVTCSRLDGSGTFARGDIDAALPPQNDRRHGYGILVGRKWMYGNYAINQTVCVDLVNASGCGSRPGDLPYDFARIPNLACVIGLGHAGVAFSVDVEDVSQECDPTRGSLILYPCACADGTVYWANLELSPALLAPFTRFVVTIRDNLGNVLIPATDVKLTGGSIDLRSVPSSVPFVQVDFDGDLPIGYTWTQPIVGELEVNNRPTLRR